MRCAWLGLAGLGRQLDAAQQVGLRFVANMWAALCRLYVGLQEDLIVLKKGVEAVKEELSWENRGPKALPFVFSA